MSSAGFAFHYPCDPYERSQLLVKSKVPAVSKAEKKEKKKEVIKHLRIMSNNKIFVTEDK